MSVEEILDRLTSIGHVVITGGEPMLFDAIEPLAAGCRDRGKHVTIETAGTIYRDLACDLMSISPKLRNSIPSNDPFWAERHEKTRLQPEVLRKLVTGFEYQLKFVVIGPGDIDEIESILSLMGDAEPSRVMLMPEGRDSEQLWQRARELVPIAMERNWRIAPRLQIDLFGDTKGT